ncbi:MAG TPA: PfkB family carbohydrate kinase [Thermoleophilaceae bacterium]|nr:PfkB family carbohydrate kinase [Thermoleophilaceae bacterium]
MKVAVVGHVEYVEFALVEHVPEPGEIVHAEDTFSEAAGGGSVAAVQLAKLAGGSLFYTALGDEELGHRAKSELGEFGVDVRCVFKDKPQRRAFTFLDKKGERTITTIHERYGPSGDDDIGWDDLADADAVYFVSGDAGALRAARQARMLVATARSLPVLKEAGVALDALVHSSNDAGERYAHGQLDPEPKLVVGTAGAEGGTWTAGEGRTGTFHAAPLPGPMADAYGAGDSFAAGLTFALGSGLEVEQALELASRCGAAATTGRGAFNGQLTAADLKLRAPR